MSCSCEFGFLLTGSSGSRLQNVDVHDGVILVKLIEHSSLLNRNLKKRDQRGNAWFEAETRTQSHEVVLKRSRPSSFDA